MKHFVSNIAIPACLVLILLFPGCGTAGGSIKGSTRGSADSSQTLAFDNKPFVFRGLRILADSAPRTYPLIAIPVDPTAKPCTLTAVGPRVLLTAAHCVFSVPDPKYAVTAIKLDQIDKAVTCQHMPSYRSIHMVNKRWEIDALAARDPSADIALCRVDTADVHNSYIPGTAPFESIDTQEEDRWLDQKVMIAGYGPISPTNSAQQAQLSAGEVTIQQTSNRPRMPRAPDPAAYADCSDAKRLLCANHMLILADDIASITEGDSGGAVYSVDGPVASLFPSMRIPPVRHIIAVNKSSEGKAQGKLYYSYAAALGNDRFVTWAAAWAKSNGVAGTPLLICGLNSSADDDKCNPPTGGGPDR